MFGLNFGTGFGRMGVGRPASGGTPTPPFAFPEDEMLLGMGLAGLYSYSGYYPFSNILWNASRWERASGTGSFTQDWGEVIAETPTDVFRCKMQEGTGLPFGTYTVLNPGGYEIGIGNASSQNLAAYTTATEFTFNYSTPQTIVALFVKGSVTNDNPIRVIMPGCRDAFLAGDYFNPQLIDFLSPLNMRCLRFMDWLANYSDMSVDWSDHPTGLPTTFCAQIARLTNKVPIQLIVALCNQLMINPWINVPARANDNYITGLATYLKDHLDPSLYVYWEGPNEIWNIAAGYIDANRWITRIDFTLYSAVPNGGDGWTLNGHGLTHGEVVFPIYARENFVTSTGGQNWPLFGATLYVDVIDANNFRLRETSVSGAIAAPLATTVKINFKRQIEAGKTADEDGNFGKFSLNMWNVADSVLGRNRNVHVLGSRFSSATTTNNRLAPTGVRAATDFAAVAPYFDGPWWVVAIDVASTQFTPKLWARYNGSSARIAFYAAGSTPTKANVLSASGAGYLAHRDISITQDDKQTWTSGSALTGLTNGTDYVVAAVLTDHNGDTWLATETVTASAAASTEWFSDSHETMAMRARRDLSVRQGPRLPNHTAVLGGIPLGCYESNWDYFGGNVALSEVRAWQADYLLSADAADTLRRYYYMMASYDLKLSNHFVDVLGPPGQFGLVENITMTTDARYLAYEAFDGSVPIEPPLSISNVIAANMLTEPSYPAVIHTFADASLTYMIYGGDNLGNFAIVGDELRIVNGTGIDWGAPTARSLKIEARSANHSTAFTISFATGFAWYEADAKFAFDAIADSDNAAMNPIRGSNLSLVVGSGATISGGMWNMDGNVYALDAPYTSAIDLGLPTLFAAVLDKDNQTTDFIQIMAFASVAVFEMQSGNMRFSINYSSVNYREYCATPLPTGKHVYWAFLDRDPVTPKLIVGVDQTPNASTITVPVMSGNLSNPRIRVGSGDITTSRSQMKHGSIQVVNRAGMTQSDALAMIAKMQTLHGI